VVVTSSVLQLVRDVLLSGCPDIPVVLDIQDLQFMREAREALSMRDMRSWDFSSLSKERLYHWLDAASPMAKKIEVCTGIPQHHPVHSLMVLCYIGFFVAKGDCVTTSVITPAKRPPKGSTCLAYHAVCRYSSATVSCTYSRMVHGNLIHLIQGPCCWHRL
jgi:hypothetical protein